MAVTAIELIAWLHTLGEDTEVRVLGERNSANIELAARPIIGTFEPSDADGEVPHCLVVPGA